MGWRSPLSHGMMFWLLSGMGLATAIPCLVVPPIEGLAALTAAERQEQARVRRLEEQVAGQKALLEAVRSDPLVNLRLARRELGYRQAQQEELIGRRPEVRVPIFLNESSATDAALPEWVARIYPARWAFIFRHGPVRHVILLMSLGLIIFALAIYDPRRVLR